MNILHDYKKETFTLEKLNELATTNPTLLIKDAEDLYHKQINDVVNDITKKDEYKIILLAGPSSSGKTTTSNLIRAGLKANDYDSLVISLDDFFLDRDRTPLLPNGDYDYENIKALDLDYLNQFVDDLFATGTALMPEYDFVTGSRKKEYKQITMKDNTMIIFEGIHALNPILFKKHNDSMYRIYICVNTNFDYNDELLIPAQKVRLMRRLIRDINHRGASLDDTYKMWPNVLAGEDLYIKPYKNTADFLINSTHAYEPMMYADMLLPLLKQNNNEISRLLASMLEKCEKLTPTMLPQNSLLHEFLDK